MQKAKVSETFRGRGENQKELRFLGRAYETFLREKQKGFSVKLVIRDLCSPEINLRVKAILPRSKWLSALWEEEVAVF